jgi:hypothetical protein
MLASSCFFALVAYLASSAFLHLSYQRFFWALLALGASVVWTLRPGEDDEGETLSRAAVQP